MGISIFYLVFIENDANCLFWIFKLHMDTIIQTEECSLYPMKDLIGPK